MPEPRDPLRALWEAVEPPPPARGLADEDAATRAAVQWLQAAHARVAPALRMPSAPRRRFRLRPLAPLAAAAALLLLLLVPPRPEPAAAAPPPPRAGVELLASGADRIELRSGTVRLILLHPQPPPKS
jgi:hypothetical protein